MTGRTERIVLYSVIAVLFVALAAVGVVTYRGAQESRAAQEKADRLTAALGEIGAHVPDREQIIGLLGNDGGRVCADPAAALGRLEAMSNGAGGPGSRPVIADGTVVRGALAIIGIYCPDKLSDFEEFVDDLRTAELTGD